MHFKKMTLVAIVVFLASCGGSSTEKKAETPEVATEQTQKEPINDKNEAVPVKEVEKKKKMEESTQEREIPLDRKGAWGKSDRFVFLENCVTSAKANMGEDAANRYCACVLEKVEQKYPRAEDASALNVNDMMEMAKNCLESN